MLRTRVGYACGTTLAPTYTNIGDHAECLQLDFDSREISYLELLQKFFAWHNPFRKPYGRQYMSAIVTEDEEQRECVAAQVAALGDHWRSVRTEVQHQTPFTWAEDYHQKYFLGKNRELFRELKERFPTSKDYVDSTAACRANAILGGHLALSEEELTELGFSPSGRLALMKRKRSCLPAFLRSND